MPLVLLDLPSEILVIICGLLATPTLYHLAQLSRRLHFITLPIYFSRTRVDLEAKTVVCTLGTTAKCDVLSALQMCLFVNSLENIKCVVPYRGSEPSIAPFLRELRRFENFISHLSSVKRVSLYIAGRDLQGRWSISLRNEEDYRAWAAHLGTLLKTIIHRDCDTLTIVDGSTVATSRPSLLNRVVQRFAPRSSKTWSIPFPTGPSRLTTLIIDSATLLVPPGVDWILAALRQAPITKFGFAMPRGDQRIWSAVLPRIAAAAPDLTMFVFTEVDASVQPLVLSILAEHFRKLTDLHISHLHPLHDPLLLDTTRPALPHVRSLRVPPTLAQHLLTPTDSLPELVVLSILWRAPPGLNLPLLFTLLRSLHAILTVRKRMPYLFMDINTRAGFAAADALLPSDITCDEQITAARSCIERLHIDLQDTSANAVDAQGIGRLVALFARVSFVAVTTRPTMSPAAVTRVLRRVRATASLTEMHWDGVKHVLQE
ncbi:hypothetical protein C8R45DRAFT_1000997 [Mycena sanguinolenta]|nr:hypothetical protein C8R45DRAFT_1000997 [Mycena sanguinolenta]